MTEQSVSFRIQHSESMSHILQNDNNSSEHPPTRKLFSCDENS